MGDAAPSALGRFVRHAAIARAGSLLLAALAHVLAVRWLGAAGYGEFVLLDAWVFALGVVALYGNHLACFALAEQQRPATARTLLIAGSGIIFLIWSAGVLLAGAAARALPTALPDGLTLAVAGIAVLGLALYRFLSELLRVAVSVELANYFSGRGTGFVSTAVFAVLVVSLGFSPAGLDDAVALLVCYAASQWIGVGLALLWLMPAVAADRTGGDSLSCAETFAALWTRGRSILATQGLQLAMGNIDLWVLGASASPATLGVYGLAKRFANWLVVPAGLIGMAGLKQAVQEYMRGDRVSRAFEIQFRAAVRMSWFGTAAIVAAAAVVPGAWLAAAAGPIAPASRMCFVALGVGQLTRLAFGNGGLMLTAAGFEADNFRAFLCGCLVSLLVALLAVPLAGEWGAVLAFSLGTSAAAVLVSRACSRRMGLDCDLLQLWRTA